MKALLIFSFVMLSCCAAPIDPASDGMHAWAESPCPILLLEGEPSDVIQMNDVQQAAGFWNDMFPGAFILSLHQDGRVVTLNEAVGDYDNKHKAAFTRLGFNENARIVSASIYALPRMLDLNDKQRVAVWRHELGHVLGLGHSSSESHVMFKRAGGNRIHESDRMFLRLQIDRGCI